MKLYLLVISMVFILLNNPISNAADTSIVGHTEITYSVATSNEIGINKELSKLMALGSAAPDYFEFRILGAHAQPYNPQLSIKEDKYYIFDKTDYLSNIIKDYEKSEAWHDFYFNAAIVAAKKGKIEQSVFLLGYALHQRADLATHQGLPNLVHAGWDDLSVFEGSRLFQYRLPFKGKAGPDLNPSRLALAHKLITLDLNIFKNSLTEKEWANFQDEHIPYKEPPMLHTSMLMKDKNITTWDPRKGLLSLGVLGGSSELNKINVESIKNILNDVNIYSYTDYRSGITKDTAINKILTTVEVLHSRQEAMFELLDVDDLDISRNSNDPPLPKPKNLEMLYAYAKDVFEYTTLGGMFTRLDTEDQKFLTLHGWKYFITKKILELKVIREEKQNILNKLNEKAIINYNAEWVSRFNYKKINTLPNSWYELMLERTTTRQQSTNYNDSNTKSYTNDGKTKEQKKCLPPDPTTGVVGCPVD
jgi:hypothetical protein